MGIFHFTPRSPEQKEAQRIFQSSAHGIQLFIGPAGTGKTQTAIALGMEEILKDKGKSLVLIRPTVGGGGENLGFLKGNLKQKMDPWMKPFFDCVEQVSYSPPMKQILVMPIAFARGLTFRNSTVILDEAQNCSWEQLIMVLTRLNHDSKLVIVGDPSQSDLRDHGRDFKRFCSLLDTIPEVSSHIFSEQFRSHLVQKVLSKLSKS